VTLHDDGQLGAAVARYAAATPDVEWRAPSELRQRAESRRRRHRIAVGSTGSLVLAVCVAITLTLPASAPRQHTANGGNALASKVVKRVTPAYGSPDQQAVEAAEQAFALHLTQDLVSGQSGNVVVSPESIETALTMLELGARGSTQHEIAAVLSSGALTASQTAEGWDALTAELASDARVSGGVLTDANAVFLQKSLSVSPAYLHALGRDFGVGVHLVDFKAGASAAAAINSWTAQVTKGRIDQMLGSSSLPPLTALVLADAVAFSARWSLPFERSTSEASFATASGSSVRVAMMHLEANLRYFSTDGLQGVVLPYAGGKFDAVVVEPRSGSLSSVLTQLTSAALSHLDAPTQLVPVFLSLPKFAVGSEESLDGTLQHLGLGPAFMSGANFSGITSRQISLGTVAQRDVLSVNQIGTDATASSSASSTFSKGTGSIQTISFDQPFLFVVRDAETGAIVTEALINDPSVVP
jgi:serpin B